MAPLVWRVGLAFSRYVKERLARPPRRRCVGHSAAAVTSDVHYRTFFQTEVRPAVFSPYYMRFFLTGLSANRKLSQNGLVGSEEKATSLEDRAEQVTRLDSWAIATIEPATTHLEP